MKRELPPSPGGTEATMVWSGSPCRILILDDDDLILRAVSRSLRSRGLTVETATDPEVALAAAAREEPHVVISDLHMPESSGALFLSAIAGVAPGALRVLMSADPDFRPTVGSVAEARVHALLSKADLGDLAGLVLALLRGRFATAEAGGEREALAHRIAHVLGRPLQEDDAHRDRTARLASRVAALMGLPPDEIEQARLGAILHDVGQIAVPQHLFGRAGRFGPEDRTQLEAHPAAGARIIDAMPALRGALAVVASHHERQDGTGYPAGLEGEAIPGAARAFQVADAYDAMTRDQAHAGARTHREAIAELTAHAGRQHDSEAVGALASLGEEGLASALRG